MTDVKMDVAIDLKKLGLAHAAGSECTCKGKHPLTITVDTDDHDLHADEECTVPALTEEAIQRLHEEAHPKGTVYAGSCYEQSCIDARSVCS